MTDKLKNEISCKENIINHLAEHNTKLQVQFKEKEKECEYWKHQAESGLDTIDSLFKDLKAKEQECEELKKDLLQDFEEKDKLHLIIDRLLEASGYNTNTASAEDFEDVYENMRYEKQQLDQLKAEVELLRQYKGSKQASYESMQEQWQKAVSQNKDLLKQNEEWQKAVSQNKDLLKQNEEWQKQVIELKTKNEELKKSVKHWQMEHKAAKAKGEWTYDLVKERLERRFDQLKAENEDLKKVSCKFKDYCTCDTEKLKQTLTEIKDIAEKKCLGCTSFCNDDNIKFCVIKQILQKISECEGNDGL